MDELAGLSEETRKLAMERFRLLQPHIENDEPLTSVARAAGIPYRTAHRLVSEYRRIGLTALVRKKRTDRGERRVVSAKLKEAIEGLALQKPPLPIAALYRQVSKLSQELGQKTPSYGTVFNIVRSLPADLVMLAHDGTKDKGADVPESFLKVQWTRLPGGQMPAAFTERVKVLLNDPDVVAKPHTDTRPSPSVARLRKANHWMVVAAAGALVVVLGGWQAWRVTQPRPKTGAPPTVPAAVAVFSPPPHSIAVLPFVNMSGDKEQEYFSEGLTEEVLNSLARLSEFQVAARTSSFSFQGEHPDVTTVAHKLNVGAVLEGSVRRAGHTVRITTQLVNSVTGFHLWSQTYDRDLKDVLKLQTEIANAVATALKVTLLGDVEAKIALGGTRIPEAFDAYLRASKGWNESQTEKEEQAVIAGYTESIRLDPSYALAYASRSIALSDVALGWAKGAAVRDYRDKAQRDARQAIALAPDLAKGHMALAELLAGSLEFARASQEYERARALAPGDAGVLGGYGVFAVEMGRTEAGFAAAHRAVELDPLNSSAHFALGSALFIAQRYGEAIVALTDAETLAPKDGLVKARLGLSYYVSGNLQSARAECENADDFDKEFCLALIYEKLGRHADAASTLATLRRSWGDDGAVIYAMIYAQWGDTARALDHLEAAVRRRQPFLLWVKAGPWFDSLRKEPRFLAIERALKFPD